MKVLFMGRKPYSCKTLEYLLEQQIDVVAVVALTHETHIYGNKKLVDVAKAYHIPNINNEIIYQSLKDQEVSPFSFSLTDIDLVISYFYWRKIKQPLINMARLGCINFHASPTPPMRGVCGYSFGIYWDLDYWGVTAHFIGDENFDTGDIIERVTFPIDLSKETALSLEEKSQPILLDLFKKVVDMAKTDHLPRIPQNEVIEANYPYNSWEDFEKLKLINTEDSPEEIDRKIRACWFPPYEGATIIIGGKRYTLLKEELLKEVGTVYRK
ncbi:formyl transferase [Thioploca ingrica]|uniref:Formyl transferase n=1 Tax=Thioploca ingrica TaxID=40754 RepID=A0A090AI46_9GAMM|nr:formyl transferase [Thioploca ingrica]